MKAFAIGALALALSLGSTVTEALAQTKVIKVATIQAANGPWHKAMLQFKELVEQRSAGALEVQVFTDGQLGDATAMMAGMQLGALEMVYQGATSGSFMKGGEPLQVMFVPYLFKDGDSAERILNSEEFQAIYDQVAANSGIRLIGAWGQRSPRALQTVSGPIEQPEDVKGLRIRIPPIALLEDTVRTLGAQVTSTGMLEIYNGLSRGSIDGQDNGFDLSYPLKLHEVANFWSETDHVRELLGWYAGEQFWQSLTDEQRQIIRDSAQEAGQVATELQRATDIESKAGLIAAGVIYTVPDKAAFAEALKEVYLPYEGKVWPEGLVARIRAMQE